MAAEREVRQPRTPRVTSPIGSTNAAHTAGVRVYVWEWPVRIVHWTIVLGIIVLSATGYYLHRPYLIAAAEGDPYLLAKVRFIHEVTAFVFTTAVLLRLYWAFVGNRYAHWRAIVPHTRSQWRGLKAMGKYYGFVSRRPPAVVGHNALAGIAYLVVYLGFIAEILTGFGLYSWLLGTEPWRTLFGWVPVVLGGSIQYVRMLHFLIMFGFLGFTIHHVYSSVLIDLEERSGLLSSIVTGFKVIPQAVLAQERTTPDRQDRPATQLGVAAAAGTGHEEED